MLQNDKVDIASGMAEEEKILRQSLSDPEAFRPIYEKYFKKIFHFVHRRVGEPDLAADLTQQVFVKALSGLCKFQFRGLPFSAWLYRVALNECNDFFRKSSRTRFVVLDESVMEQLYDEVVGDSLYESWAKRLPEILGMLKENELQLIELRFFEGRPFKEIGELLGITETYAKVKTYRILEKMKKLFNHR